MDELDAPPTPGRILLDEYLTPRKITAAQLAAAIHVPEVRIAALLSGKAGMLTDTAVRLARYFGTTERYWVDLQSDYDLFWARTRLEYDLSAIVPRGAGTGPT